MSTLTEQYVAETVKQVPRRRREEIARELDELVNEQIDERVANGEAREDAEREVLQDFGDPMVLGASYADRQLALIGPALYPSWKRILVLLLGILVPLLGILAGVGAAVGGKDVGSILGAVVGAAATAVVQVSFWVTLVFALVDRFASSSGSGGGSADGGDGGEKGAAAWTPDDLSPVVENQISRGDVATDVVANAVGVFLLVYQQLWLNIGGVQMSVVNPAVAWWTWLTVATFVLTAVVTLWGRKTGGVRAIQVVCLVVLAAVQLVPTIYLALNNELLNPQFVDQFEWLADNVTSVNALIIVGFIVAWGIDIFDRGRKALRG